MTSDGLTTVIIAGILALFLYSRVNARIRRLTEEVDGLRKTLQQVIREIDDAAADRQERAEAPGSLARNPQPDPPLAPAAPPTPKDMPTPAAAPMEDRVLPVSLPPWPDDRERQETREAFEKTLATRWLVWLGGLTLAIAGLFLARFAVEQGLLGPGARMVLGGLFGVALIGGGEFLSRRKLARSIGRLKPDQVPVALVAAGLSVLFAVIYASQALHDLIGVDTGFALLALTSLAGFPLALRHGGFVALLAYAGGLLLPLLIKGAAPATLVDAVWVAVLLVVLFMAAARLGAAWLLIAGGLCHGLLVAKLSVDIRNMFNGAWPVWAVGALLPLPTLALTCVERARWTVPHRWGQACLIVAGLAGLNVGWLILLKGYPSVVWLELLLLPGLFAWLGRKDDRGAVLWPAGAALLSVAGLWALATVWKEPATLWPLLAVALVYLIVSLAGLMFMVRPILAALSGVAVPVILSIGALKFLWLENKASLGLPWLLPLLAAAGFVLTMPPIRMELAARSRAPEQAETALTFYGAMGLLVLAVLPAFWLEKAALTLAVALLVPVGAALAWSMSATALLRAAGLLAGIVLARFLMNGGILDYPLIAPIHWPLWAMGGSAAAIYLASLLTRAADAEGLSPRGRVGDVLLIAALVLGIAAVTLEIRVWTNGGLNGGSQGLLEVSLRSLAWLAVGLGARQPGRHPWVRAFGSVLTVLALAEVLLMHLLVLNPLWSDNPVGRFPLLNLLALAYLLPAILLLVARRTPDVVPSSSAAAVEGSALFLLMVYALLSVRQLFHGDLISLEVAGPPSDWEMYCYSGLGLLAVLVLILGAIRTGRADMRNAAMAILLLTVAKVFLWDMSGLTGVPRILSFLGLGLSLIGIGWLYQRFVFPVTDARARAADGD